MRKFYFLYLVIFLSAVVFAQSNKQPLQQQVKVKEPNRTDLRAAVDNKKFNLMLEDSIVVFKEDWEGGFNWTTVDETDIGVKWHLDAFNAYGGSGLSWWVGDPEIGTQGGYDSHWYQVLDSDPVSITGTAPVLTFYHRYKVEAPGGEPAGYNGWDGMNVRISTDNGTTWTVLTNPTPAYTSTSLYSFGFEWGEGPGVPGWAGASTTWQQVSINLAAYTGQTVQIRFAFASDPGYATPEDPTLFGWQIDNIQIADGATVLFSNDGTSAAGLTGANNGDVGGDLWRITTEAGSPSPTHFITANDSATNTYVPNMINSVVSDYFHLADSLSEAWLDFYLQGSWIDNDQFPEVDYFGAFVQVKGEASWRYVSNITRDPNGNNYVYSDAPLTWARFSDTYSSGVVDLSPLIGDSVRIKFTFYSDEDQPLGKAVQIDDVVVWTSDQPVVLIAPQNLTAEQSGDSVLLNWDDLNAGGFQLVQYDDNTFENGIHLNSGTADAAAYVNVNNSVTLDTVWIYGYTGNTATSTTLKVWPAPGGTPAATPSYTQAITITANQWNAIDVRGANLTFNDDFLVGFEINTPIWVALDQTSIPSSGSYVNLGSWATWAATASANSLPDGEWGIRASVTSVPGENVTYNVYRKLSAEPGFTTMLAGGLADPSYIDTTAEAGNNYCYAVKALYGAGESGFSNEACVTITYVEGSGTVPAVFSLGQNYPNPFNPVTNINFALPVEAKVSLKIYDILGRELLELANDTFGAGTHTIRFNAVSLSSGIYFYTIEAAGADGKTYKSSKKLTLLK